MKTVLNFSHTLTDQQKEQVQSLLGEEVTEVPIPLHFDQDKPFLEQVRAVLSGEVKDILVHNPQDALVIPPALSPIACLVVAELQGLAGHFLPMVRIKPVLTDLGVSYDAAEIINLQAARDQARARRLEGK
jgi:hypothetical protein